MTSPALSPASTFDDLEAVPLFEQPSVSATAADVAGPLVLARVDDAAFRLAVGTLIHQSRQPLRATLGYRDHEEVLFLTGSVLDVSIVEDRARLRLVDTTIDFDDLVVFAPKAA